MRTRGRGGGERGREAEEGRIGKGREKGDKRDKKDEEGGEGRGRVVGGRGG